MSELFDEAVFKDSAPRSAKPIHRGAEGVPGRHREQDGGARKQRNAPLIKREAHSIKSSAATFGFSDLSRLARELEFGAETVTPAKLQVSLGELQQTFKMTRQFAQSKLLGGELAI